MEGRAFQLCNLIGQMFLGNVICKMNDRYYQMIDRSYQMTDWSYQIVTNLNLSVLHNKIYPL